MPIFKDKEKRSRRAFNIRDDILEELEIVAKEAKRTKGEVVETALEYLFNLIKEEKQNEKDKKSE